MAWVPKFILYNSNGTFRYIFPVVQYTNAPQNNKKNVVISGLRGQGAIIIEGSESEWDLVIRFILLAEDYTALTTKIDALETALPSLTPFIVRIEKSESTVYEYKVIRVAPIEYSESFRIYDQEVTITLKVNSW